MYIRFDYYLSSCLQSIMTIGALFGGPVAGLVSDRFGRKTGFMLISLPGAIGWFSITVSQLLIPHQMFVPFLVLLLIGRFVSGFAAGCFSLVVPVS